MDISPSVPASAARALQVTGPGPARSGPAQSSALIRTHLVRGPPAVVSTAVGTRPAAATATIAAATTTTTTAGGGAGASVGPRPVHCRNRGRRGARAAAAAGVGRRPCPARGDWRSSIGPGVLGRAGGQSRPALVLPAPAPPRTAA